MHLNTFYKLTSQEAGVLLLLKLHLFHSYACGIKFPGEISLGKSMPQVVGYRAPFTALYGYCSLQVTELNHIFHLFPSHKISLILFPPSAHSRISSEPRIYCSLIVQFQLLFRSQHLPCPKFIFLSRTENALFHSYFTNTSC